MKSHTDQEMYTLFSDPLQQRELEIESCQGEGGLQSAENGRYEHLKARKPHYIKIKTTS